MSRGIFLGTIVFRSFFKTQNLMIEKIIKKQSSEEKKDFKKSNLDILTKENDLLLKSLKRPGGHHRSS